MPSDSDQTPRPPATAEFGSVTPGGPAHTYEATAALGVTKLSVGSYDNNVYVLTSGEETVIVDGAADAGRILEVVGDRRVTGILQTHGHFDHVQALPDLVAAWGCPVYAHPGDAGRMGVETVPLTGRQTLAVGGTSLTVLHTPGHTPGSLCFVADGFLFSGDTLFPAGPGATDGDPTRFAAVMASLDRLFELPDATRVCPGHGLDTTIGRERPYVETWRRRGW